jgi:hypothetical protein
VAAWLEFFFRSTLSFFSTSGTKTENSLLGEEQNRGERWSSGKVAKASWRKNKSGGDVKLGRKGAFASAVLGNGFLYPLWGCNGHLTIRISGVDDMELHKVSSWGLGVVSIVAEKDGDVTSWRHTVVTLMTTRFNRSKELTVMGRRTRKAQCTSLYACDGNEEKRSQKLRSILRVLPCLLLMN